MLVVSGALITSAVRMHDIHMCTGKGFSIRIKVYETHLPVVTRWHFCHFREQFEVPVTIEAVATVGASTSRAPTQSLSNPTESR